MKEIMHCTYFRLQTQNVIILTAFEIECNVADHLLSGDGLSCVQHYLAVLWELASKQIMLEKGMCNKKGP